MNDVGVFFVGLVAAGDSVMSVREHLRGHSQLYAESKDGCEWKLEATLNYRLSRKMAGGGMCTCASRPMTTVLHDSILTALLESDTRKDIGKATFGVSHVWGWSSHSHL